MMANAVHALEQRLIDGYRRQADAYERALRILDLQATPVDTLVPASWAMELHEALQVVNNLDAELTEDKKAWRLAAHRPGQELRTLLERLAQQISRLTAKIDGEIAALVARKERLAPEIDVFLRQRSMLNAYSGAKD